MLDGLPPNEREAFFDGFNQAKEALEKTPSQMMPVLKETALLGTGVFRIFSGLDAIYNIYSIFKNEGFKGSPTDIAIRGVRVVANLGVIALSAVAAAVAFGATVLAAPIVGAVLGGISVFKNTFDLIAERRKSAKIKTEIKKLDKQLEVEHIHVAQNLELLNDLGQRKAHLAELKQSLKEIKTTVEKFESGSDAEKIEIIKARKATLEKSINANKAIDGFLKNNKDKIQDPKALGVLIETMGKQKDVNESVIKFAGELNEAQKSLRSLKEQLQQVTGKYNKAPFENLNDKDKKRLAGLDGEFLETRITEQEKKIEILLDPNQRAQANSKSARELEQYADPSAPQSAIAFKKNMQDDMSAINEKGLKESKELKERVGYTKLFLGADFLNDPQKGIKTHLEANFKNTLDRAKLSHDLKQSKIERNKKWKNIGLGLLGFGIAVAACIPPAQALLGLGLIAVGVVSGINAIYDYKKKRDTGLESKAEITALSKAHVTTSVKTLSQTPTNLHELHSALEAGPSKENEQHPQVHTDSAPTFVSGGPSRSASIPTSSRPQDPAPTVEPTATASRQRIGSK